MTNGLKLKDGGVQVFDTSGNIDVSNLESGIYFLELKNVSDKSVIAKFVKL